ncbi:hypothetical protein Hanom_Chr04g00351791 [Helianthus anomalus]
MVAIIGRSGGGGGGGGGGCDVVVYSFENGGFEYTGKRNELQMLGVFLNGEF